jgi:hypothetical protein
LFHHMCSAIEGEGEEREWPESGPVSTRNRSAREPGSNRKNRRKTDKPGGLAVQRSGFFFFFFSVSFLSLHPVVKEEEEDTLKLLKKEQVFKSYFKKQKIKFWKINNSICNMALHYIS